MIQTDPDRREELEDQLRERALSFKHDPYGFVMWAFPWAEPDAELEFDEGPNEWQTKTLKKIGEHLRDGATVHEVLRIAVTSGHGIGKSALVAWIVLWALATMVGTKVVATANTETQLQKKTWSEVSKWHGLMLCSHWFRYTATTMHRKSRKYEKIWRADAITWNEKNPESFAGLHNKGKRIVLLYDEASAIPDNIWETTEGALTDSHTEIIWLVFGNPTRNTGRFRECFGRRKHRWYTMQVDARDVPGTNKKLLDQWIEDYGEDSDFARVRVKGQFPRASTMQFMASDVVRKAMECEVTPAEPSDPLVLGVDVARFGDDESVIQGRRGQDARNWGRWVYRGLDTMQLAAQVAEKARGDARGHNKADMIFVDETGIGAGVVDRLRLMGFAVMGVNFGGTADGGFLSVSAAAGEKYRNKASEMWGVLRSWMKSGGAIDDESDLEDQLTGREYGYTDKNEIQLEKKDDMKKRDLSSPDRADALGLTFAYPVVSSQLEEAMAGDNQNLGSGYDPYGRD